MRALPLPARLYVASVLAAACLLVCLAVRYLPGAKVTDVVVLGALYLISESLSSRGSRDLLTISLGSVVIMAAIPLVGVWGAVLVAWTSAFAHEPQETTLVKRAFNGAMLVVSASAAGGAYHALGGGVGLDAADFPGVLGPIVAADLVQCAVNGGLVAIIVGLSSRVSPLRGLPGHDGPFRPALPRVRAVRRLARGALGPGADVGPAAALLLLLPLFVARWAYAQYAEEQRAYDRTVRTLMAAVETKDLYTRGHSERVSAGSVLIAREHRHARGPCRLAALRRDAARRRQARRADAGAAEVRPPHRRRVRGDPAAPGARAGDRPRDRVPRRGVRRDHAPPRAARRPRLPDGPARRRRSRSSRGSSRSPTPSTR